jgi:hypothetical protein
MPALSRKEAGHVATLHAASLFPEKADMDRRRIWHHDIDENSFNEATNRCKKFCTALPSESRENMINMPGHGGTG